MQSHSLTLVHALAASLALACGGNSSKSKDSGAGEGTSTGSGGGAASSGIGGTGGTGGTSGGNVSTGGGDGGSGGSSSNGGGSSNGGASATSGGGNGGVGGGDRVASTGSGAAAGAGAGGGSGGTGGSGGSESTGVIGILGDPCDSPGQLACAGNHQKLTLVCGPDGMWETNQICEASEFCDSTPGSNAGTCSEQHSQCTNRQPGEHFCEANTEMECGPDTVTVEVYEECSGICVEGTCDNDTNRCPEGNYVDCSGDCTESLGVCMDCPARIALSMPDDGLTIRLPAYEDACSFTCGSELRGAVFSGRSVPFGQRFRVQSQLPWRVFAGSGLPDAQAPCSTTPGSTCAVVESNDESLYFFVFTDDPSAGVRNVLIEPVDQEATCP